MRYFVSYIIYLIKIIFLIFKFNNYKFKNIAPKNRSFIVINTIRLTVISQLFFELLLAMKLSRYHKVIIVYDSYDHLDHDTLNVTSKNLEIFFYRLKQKSCLFLLKIFLNNNFKFLSSSELIGYKALSNDNNVNIYDTYRSYIDASITRYYKSAPVHKVLNRENSYHEIKKKYIKIALNSHHISSVILNKFHIKAVISSHAIYASWGVSFANYKKSNIRCISYGGNGFRNGVLDIALNEVAAKKYDQGYFKLLLSNTRIDNKFILKINKMLNKRMNGGMSDTKVLTTSNFKLNLNSVNLKKLKKAKEDKKLIITLFPNVTWDNATTFEDQNTIFDNNIDWIISTLKYVIKNNLLLVIRSHPAEGKLVNSRVTIKDILKLYFNEKIFDNPSLLFIESKEKILSYELIKYSDAITVYNGTIGLEGMYLQKPVLVASNCAYKMHKFTYNIEDKQQFFRHFTASNLVKITKHQKKNYKIFLVYVLYYFSKGGVKLKFFSDKNFLEPNYRLKSRKIFNDKKLNHLVDYILDKRKFVEYK